MAICLNMHLRLVFGVSDHAPTPKKPPSLTFPRPSLKKHSALLHRCALYSFMPSAQVILAEKDPIIAEDIRTILEAQGMQVIELTGDQAIQDVCEQYHPEFAILNITHSSYADGMALATMLRWKYLVKVLLITGLRQLDLMASRHFDANLPVLHKPFSRAQLRQSLNSL